MSQKNISSESENLEYPKQSEVQKINDDDTRLSVSTVPLEEMPEVYAPSEALQLVDPLFDGNVIEIVTEYIQQSSDADETANASNVHSKF